MAASAAYGDTPEAVTPKQRSCWARTTAIPADHRPEPGIRGTAGDRAAPPDRRGAGFLRAVLGRRLRARDLRRGSPAADRHGGFLARLDQPGQLSRSPVAQIPAEVRADARGLDLRAYRGVACGRDHIATGDPGRGP